MAEAVGDRLDIPMLHVRQQSAHEGQRMADLFLPRQVIHERLHELLQPRRNIRENLRREFAFLQHRRLARLKLLFLKLRIHAYTPSVIEGPP